MVNVQGLNSIKTKEACWLGNSYRNHEVLDINKVNEPIKRLVSFSLMIS